MKEMLVKDIVESVSETHLFNKEELYAINTSDILEGKLINFNLIKSDELKGQFKKTIKKDDILFSEIRPANKRYAKVTWDNTDDCVVSTKLMVLRKYNIDVDLNYFYYWLTNPNMLSILQKRAENRICSFPQITFDVLSNYRIPVPSLQVQQSISKLLSDIDSKIENNNKIISELESMAKTIYDYWFLQFEFPNEDGKPYKSSGGKMVWNEELKREIPEGWEVFMVKDFCDIFTGKKDVNQALDTGKYKFFSCAPGYKYSNDKLYTGKAILISGNGSYTGRTIFVNDSFDLYQRTYACVMKPNYDNMLEYIFYTMKTFFVKRVSGGTHGSAIPYIVYNDIANEYFYYNKEVVDTFMKTIESIQEHIIKLSKESQELASLRDFLLPMLMNGQVTFKEDE